MKHKGTRGLALVLLFVCALAAPAATATKKKTSTAKKPVASSTTHKKTTAAPAKKGSTTAARSSARSSTTARRGTSSSRRGSTTATRHPAPPPRQNTPSPERYREIQQALVERGYADGTPDGVWSPQWIDSLRRFQTDQNLEADGKLGALSLIALGLGPKRQALQLPPPAGSSQTNPSQQLLAKPVE